MIIIYQTTKYFYERTGIATGNVVINFLTGLLIKGVKPIQILRFIIEMRYFKNTPKSLKSLFSNCYKFAYCENMENNNTSIAC